MTGPDLILTLARIGAVVGPAILFFAWRRWGRKSVAVSAVLVLGAAIYAVAVWGVLIEPATLTVRRVAIASPTWRGPPLRIAILSDTHVGAPHVDAGRVRRVIARINAERPDIVVFLGGGRKLFVSGGLGVSILPVRFGAPPEFDIVTLSAAP